MNSSILLSSLFVVVSAPILGHAQMQPAAGPRVFMSANTPGRTNTPNVRVRRGYTIVDAQPALGGADVTVEIFQDRLNAGVNLSLQAVVVDDKKQTFVIPLMLLEKSVQDPQLYYQKRVYHIDYAQLQARIDQHAAGSPQLKLSPGDALFVKADFEGGHNWGGVDRGGGFFMPPPLDNNGQMILTDSRGKETKAAAQVHPNFLDVAYTIPSEMTNVYNDPSTHAGLKPNGQVRSRIEGEGKFQLTEQQMLNAKTSLYNLSRDPVLAAKVLGPNWVIKPVDRYYRKDAVGKLLQDENGFPIPDPMVDTYYDSKDLLAAQNDMAIRYRWTEGNQTGAWNFKPGIGRTDPNGVVYRVEYGVDTTDDKPQTLAKFADSMHPLNPFKYIREKIPGATPSQFLEPSVKITDVRHKFMLEHKSGLKIEVSVDEVHSKNLRRDNAETKFYQLEMDIDHLATASNTVVASSATGYKYLSVEEKYQIEDQTGYLLWPGTVNPVIDPATQKPYTVADLHRVPPAFTQLYRWVDTKNAQEAVDAFIKTAGANAYFDGRPVLHDESDTNENGSLLMSRANDFKLSSEVIGVLRKATIGEAWRSGAQKYAFASAALDNTGKQKISGSVNPVKDLLPSNSASVLRCQAVLMN